MKTSILVGLEDDEKKEIEREYASCLRFRKQVISMLERDIDILVSQLVDNEEVGQPNWEVSQINKTSEIRAKRKLISLLK
jgi:hypothetical protein